MFTLEQRPANLGNAQIMNVQVRGKRGNIVQVYPAVEYDFFPTNLTVTPQDLVHFQWTGKFIPYFKFLLLLLILESKNQS